MNTKEIIRYSIIIPHKNCPSLLIRCLKSIPRKDDIEIIIVDDNSDNDKKPIIDRDDAKILFLNKAQSNGAGKARNVGLSNTRGRWILFADSDDYFVDNFYEIISGHSDSKADMILFKSNSVISDTLEQSDRHLSMNEKLDRYFRGEISAKLASLDIEVPWCKMLSADFLNKNNIKFDEVLASNDTMFSTKATCLANNIEISNSILYVVTYRDGSLWTTRKAPSNYLTRINVYIDRAKYLKAHGFVPSPLLLSYFSFGYIDMRSNLMALWAIIKNGCLFTGIFHYLIKRMH